MAKWGFLTNHAVVLVHIYQHPSSTLREISDAIGITERAALSIVRQLQADNCVSLEKKGRRNHYTVNLQAILARPTQGNYELEAIVTGLARLAEELRQRRQQEGGPGDEDGGPGDDDGDQGDENGESGR